MNNVMNNVEYENDKNRTFRLYKIHSDIVNGKQLTNDQLQYLVVCIINNSNQITEIVRNIRNIQSGLYK